MPTPNYKNPTIRRNAAARAAKLMKLFNSPNFENIMTAVDPKPATRAGSGFDAACTAAGLTAEETDWLWAYLSQCDNAVYSPAGVREAAGSGW